MSFVKKVGNGNMTVSSLQANAFFDTDEQGVCTPSVWKIIGWSYVLAFVMHMSVMFSLIGLGLLLVLGAWNGSDIREVKQVTPEPV